MPIVYEDNCLPGCCGIFDADFCCGEPCCAEHCCRLEMTPADRAKEILLQANQDRYFWHLREMECEDPLCNLCGAA